MACRQHDQLIALVIKEWRCADQDCRGPLLVEGRECSLETSVWIGADDHELNTQTNRRLLLSALWALRPGHGGSIAYFSEKVTRIAKTTVRRELENLAELGAVRRARKRVAGSRNVTTEAAVSRPPRVSGGPSATNARRAGAANTQPSGEPLLSHVFAPLPRPDDWPAPDYEPVGLVLEWKRAAISTGRPASTAISSR